MSARDTVLAKVRRALGVTGEEGSEEAERRRAVAERLANPKPNLIPARGQLDGEGRVALFIQQAKSVSATVEQLATPQEVPGAIAAHLRRNNLPAELRTGDDPAIAALPWEREPQLSLKNGPSDGHDATSLSHAFGGVAESGTLVLLSGPDNPTTLNFLPDMHIVMVSADEIAGDYETVWQRLRERRGSEPIPRTVNLITGPSRSADIEQTLILGAHGPRALHILVVG